MKTSLPLCTLVLIAVGLTMVRASCDVQGTLTCRNKFMQDAASLGGDKDAFSFCQLYSTFMSCVRTACPDEAGASTIQAANDMLKQLGFNCSHASHLVSAQAMPVLLLFIIGLFFGVF